MARQTKKKQEPVVPIDHLEPRLHPGVPGDHPNRKWEAAHLDAGYHRQTWLAATDDHPILGNYVIPDGAYGGSCEVVHLPVGHTKAPEYRIECADGFAVTVLDDTVVAQYLLLWGAERA